MVRAGFEGHVGGGAARVATGFTCGAQGNDFGMGATGLLGVADVAQVVNGREHDRTTDAGIGVTDANRLHHLSGCGRFRGRMVYRAIQGHGDAAGHSVKRFALFDRQFWCSTPVEMVTALTVKFVDEGQLALVGFALFVVATT